ncbi:MAG: type II toxin-antitoxin system Phd/YefM family antitoxin [SAR202 cluster bacterium]|nr:type II toxin-antitoxin system Phd/YefM family antitoxin [SAR202 cluster bacterium]
MVEVGIRELKQNASSILRKVREEKETITITHRGRAIAKLVPVEDAESQQEEFRKVWAEMDELAKKISAHWPKGVSAAEAVAEQRREL